MAAPRAVAKAGVWQTFRDSPLPAKVILSGVIINRLSSFLTVFLVLYATARGYSAGQAVFALGAYGIGGIAGSLLGGALSERLGPRNATVLSMAATSVLTASVLFVPTYPLLVGAVALIGLTSQIFRPASATLLSDLTPDDRQVMIFAIWRFGLNLGAAAAPLLGFALYYLGQQHYTLLFLAEALVDMVYAVLAWLLLSPRLTSQAAAAPAAADQEATDSRGSGYLAILRDHPYAVFLVAALVHTIVYQQYMSTLPLTVNAQHLSIFWYTLAVSLNGVVVIALELPATRFTQGLPTRLPIAIGLALVGIGVAVYGFPLLPFVILTGTLIWSLGEIVSAPSLFAYPAMVGAGRLKSRYIGSFQFMFGIGSAAAPLIGGWLFIHTGASTVWPTLGAVEVLVALSMLALVRTPVRAPGTGTNAGDAIESSAQ
jgi:MFS family permease